MIESGKKPDYKLFDKAVKEAYNKYCNKFQIRELPHELEQKMLEKNSNFAYRPVNLRIGGKTECFSKEVLNDF